jgi:hypothetical protein
MEISRFRGCFDAASKRRTRLVVPGIVNMTQVLAGYWQNPN